MTKSALKHAAWDHDFIERFGLVEDPDPFWAAVRDALEVIIEDREQVHPVSV